MNACLYEEVVIGCLRDRSLTYGEGRPITGHLAKLFLTDVPADISLEDLQGTLRDAGPLLLKIPIDWKSYRVALEGDWPDQIRKLWESRQGRSESWDVFAQPRRITIRLSMRLFAAAEGEARLRGQSLNQFCVDSLAAHVRTRSKRLELLALEDAQQSHDPDGMGRSLGNLFNIFSVSVPDCRHEEIVDTLKRLARREYLVVTKWSDERGFLPYVPDEANDQEFFYRGEFRYKLHEYGRPYLEGLRSAFGQSMSASA